MVIKGRAKSDIQVGLMAIYNFRTKEMNIVPEINTVFPKLSKMLFSFKNKYHYTYPNTYIALYSRTPKLPVTHTHPQKQEIVVHPSYARYLVS